MLLAARWIPLLLSLTKPADSTRICQAVLEKVLPRFAIQVPASQARLEAEGTGRVVNSRCQGEAEVVLSRDLSREPWSRVIGSQLARQLGRPSIGKVI